MKIGIDISQIAYEHTGVSNYLLSLLEQLLSKDTHNHYVLFGSSLRQRSAYEKVRKKYKNKTNVEVKIFNIPPKALDILWNTLHIAPIEWFVGDVDVFITSDWTEPPAKKAKKATILYDLIVYRYPEETAADIVRTQKRKLRWVIKESAAVFCISQSTKSDAKEILGIDDKRLFVAYPGM